MCKYYHVCGGISCGRCPEALKTLILERKRLDNLIKDGEAYLKSIGRLNYHEYTKQR